MGECGTREFRDEKELTVQFLKHLSIVFDAAQHSNSLQVVPIQSHRE